LADAKLTAERKRAEELAKLAKEAGTLVREAIAKAVALDPKDIDSKLVEQAAALVKENT